MSEEPNSESVPEPSVDEPSSSQEQISQGEPVPPEGESSSTEEQITPSAPVPTAGRPGCVTVYALLLIGSGFIGGLGLLCVLALAGDPIVADAYQEVGISGAWFAIALPSAVLLVLLPLTVELSSTMLASE